MLGFGRMGASHGRMGAPGITRLSPSAVLDFREGIGLDRITTSRNTAATAIRASDGAVLDFAANAPRIVPGEGLDVWEATDEKVPNSVGGGAVLGFIGSGGAHPSGWSNGPLTNCTLEVTGTGIEDGIPYIEYQIVATGTGGARIQFASGSGAPISASTQYISSAYFRRVAGDFTNIPVAQFRATEFPQSIVGTSVSIVGMTNAPLRSQRVQLVKTSLSDTANARIEIAINPSGPALIRFRVGLPSVRPSSFLAPPVKTSGTAAIVPEDRVNIANIGNILDLSKGSLVIHARTEIVGFATNRTLFAATVDGSNGLRAIVTSANLLQFLYFIDNVSVGSVIATVPISAGVPFKVAVRWALNDFALTATGMGSSVVKDTSGAVLSAAPVAGRIGRFSDNLQPFNGRISRVELFRKLLSDADLLAKVA